jgi:hypothetical protein
MLHALCYSEAACPQCGAPRHRLPESKEANLRRCSRAGDQIDGARPFPGKLTRVSTSPDRVVWLCTPPRDATAWRRFQVLRN